MSASSKSHRMFLQQRSNDCGSAQLKLDLITPEHVEELKNNNWVHLLLHLFPVAMETRLLSSNIQAFTGSDVVL